jgi:hypothetical protein
MPKARTWDVVERCLALLVCLTRGPATTQELYEIIQNYDDKVEISSSEALAKRLSKDLRKLKEIFGCDIRFTRNDSTYTLLSMDRPLIDLPEEAMRGLAFLHKTFSDDTTLMGDEVRALITLMFMLIGETRQDEVRRMRGLLEVDLHQRDEDNIPDDIWAMLEKACMTHRELEFKYLSPRHEALVPRTHHVEPIRCYFDSVRGHSYLEAYCIENRGPEGIFPGNEVWHYRIGRISDPQILPKRFVPGQRRLKTYDLIYELKPQVARLGVTRHIPNSQVEKKPDGGAIVRAVSTNLFTDLRTLLHYGDNCHVLGGEEALRQMRALVAAMYEQYREH